MIIVAEGNSPLGENSLPFENILQLCKCLHKNGKALSGQEYFHAEYHYVLFCYCQCVGKNTSLHNIITYVDGQHPVFHQLWESADLVGPLLVFW